MCLNIKTFKQSKYLKMGKTILVYWPAEGNVENCAKMIAEEFGDIDYKLIDQVSAEDFSAYKQFIVGCSTVGSETWESTENTDAWPDFIKKFDENGLSEKTIALYGLGDQIRWPMHYVDGMAVLYESFTKSGAHIVGKWPVEGYDHEESEAQQGDFFYGLALDEDHQPELSKKRIEKWVKQIKEEF